MQSAQSFVLTGFFVCEAALDPVGTEDLGISTIQKPTWIYIVLISCISRKRNDLDITNIEETDHSFSGILQYPKLEITILAFLSKGFFGYVELNVP
jgi:hypothetical protein